MDLHSRYAAGTPRDFQRHRAVDARVLAQVVLNIYTTNALLRTNTVQQVYSLRRNRTQFAFFNVRTAQLAADHCN